ncbi:MAG: dicarboxylate/amino acid:cation symporter [Candidatus Aminicenantes bacterium]|nr:dicarboxylate/amino acid:cation symporter [Candidatus Aminicenantes bacterium]
MKLKGKVSLPTKILIGLIIGIIVGLTFGPKATIIEPIGTIFLRLITLVVVPLVFVSLLLGTAGVGDIKKVGRMGLKTLGYFIFTTVLAITVGLILANVVKPGSGLSPEVQARIQQTTESQSSIDLQRIQKPSTIQILVDIIPTNPLKAFAESNMLQIIFMALLFGTVITMIPRDKAQPVLVFLDGLNDAIIQIVHIAMKLAPYGVLALIASVTGKFGINILFTLFKYAVTVIGGLFLYGFFWNTLAVSSFGQMNPVNFFRGVREALLIAFSTSSSSATLPVAIDCLDRIGIKRQYSSFVMPLGATINMDGTALYQGVSAVFIAQLYGIPIGISGQLMIVLMATLASIGAAGVPSAGIITLVMVLKQIGVPLEGLALILGVERLLDMCRTTVNVMGNLACSVVIQRWEKGHL